MGRAGERVQSQSATIIGRLLALETAMAVVEGKDERRRALRSDPQTAVCFSGSYNITQFE